MFMNSPNTRLVIAAGGTGGHFLPALAIAREYRCRGGGVTFFVGGQNLERHLSLAAAADISAIPTVSVRWPSGVRHWPTFVVRFLTAVRRARSMLRDVEPCAVLGMGSFAAAPACAAALTLRIPLYLHEGNAVLGTTNALLAGRASCIALSLPGTRTRRTVGASVVTGLPLREDLLHAAALPSSENAVRRQAGLSPDKTTLLVFGGSQGAAVINRLLVDTLPLLAGHAGALQVIHLTGEDNNAAIEAAYRGAGIEAIVRPRADSMATYYQAADLVICRAGASSIAELALFGKPAILIPLPTAAKDHQTANAAVLAARNAAIHLSQKAATPPTCANLISRAILAPEEYAALATGIRTFSRPDAAQAVVDMLTLRKRRHTPGD